LFFSPELVEPCRRAWESSCRKSHTRIVKMDYAKILTHARYLFISDIYSEPRLADNSCPAYWRHYNHFPTSPTSYCATVVCSAGQDCKYRLLARGTTWVSTAQTYEAKRRAKTLCINIIVSLRGIIVLRNAVFIATSFVVI
jgi:hypothetical protein